MADQAQLDLQPPAKSSGGSSAPPRVAFAGFTRSQIIAGTAALLLFVWAMWVTHAVIRPPQGTIVAARLSGIVGDYVEAQRFSGAPPERVKLEMQAFMASLDKELQRRSAAGEIVLVGEAVLTKSVPDITDDLKNAVFASGVPLPKRASVEELQRMQQQAKLAAMVGVPAADVSRSTAAFDQMPALATPATGAGSQPGAFGVDGE